MIIELGHFALALALAVSAVQAVSLLAYAGLSLVSAKADQNSPLPVHRLILRASLLLFGLLTVALLALIYAYAVSDFSVLSVARNSHALMPLHYRIAATWGNHEGSMLLWVWMLSLWGFFAARSKEFSTAFLARALACQGMIAFGFIAFIMFTSNPFVRLFPPALEGLGLNPMLQDPALAIHPPLLYTGYVGFSVAFCFAMAALLEDGVTPSFAARLRPWVLSAWAFLTAGITAGSFWAYYELGWGGFWFWDPVENASLLPWFAGAALLHSAVVLEKRGTLAGWTVFLSILAFSLSLLGTFIVRSGILTSVHAFASDPKRGIFILLLLTVAIGAAFLLYAFRAPRLLAGDGFSLFSREGALALNNVFLFTFCATVLVGTLYPVFLSALGLGSVSVGSPYYRATMLPLFVPFALLMGAAPYAAWKTGDARKVIRHLGIALSFALWAALLGFLKEPEHPLALLGLLLGGWIGAAALHAGMKRPNARRGMAAAHFGFAMLIVGVSATTQWGAEKILWMNPGDRVEVAGAKIVFLGAEQRLGEDYNADTGVFLLNDSVYMTPEKRWYPASRRETSETALHRYGHGFFYLVMGESDHDVPARRVVRVYHHPFVIWIFVGGVLMGVGGIIAAIEGKRARRHAK